MHWPIGDRIEFGLPGHHSGRTETRQERIMQIRSTVGHDINDDEPYPLLEIGRTLRDEGIPMGWTIFVRRTH
jgi:hypothetical protein